MVYFRVSVLGTIGTEEKWSVNPVFDPTLEFPGEIDQTNLDTAALAIANLAIPAGLAMAMSAAFSRNGCRIEVRDDSNDALVALSIQGSTTVVAGTGTGYHPFQSAIVCSVRTNTPGASGRGRLYWPAVGVTINSTGRITLPTNSVLAGDFKTYLTGMRSALASAFPTIGFDLAVRSKTTHTTPHATRLQVGTIVDTQRRRRDKLPESYASVTFP